MTFRSRNSANPEEFMSAFNSTNDTTSTGRWPVSVSQGGEDGDSLDRVHQARVTRVAACDMADDRRAAAQEELARLIEEEQHLLAELDVLGGSEHIDAIKKSQWLPYQPALQKGARMLWFVDGLLWTALSASIVSQLWRGFHA
jgi:hypothetical protein